MLQICSFCKTGLLCVISTPATQDSGGYGFRHGRLWDLIVHLICIGQPFSPHILSNASMHSIQYFQSFKNLNPASRFREAKLLTPCMQVPEEWPSNETMHCNATPAWEPQPRLRHTKEISLLKRWPQIQLIMRPPSQDSVGIASKSKNSFRLGCFRSLQSLQWQGIDIVMRGCSAQ